MIDFTKSCLQTSLARTVMNALCVKRLINTHAQRNKTCLACCRSYWQTFADVGYAGQVAEERGPGRQEVRADLILVRV